MAAGKHSRRGNLHYKTRHLTSQSAPLNLRDFELEAFARPYRYRHFDDFLRLPAAAGVADLAAGTGTWTHLAAEAANRVNLEWMLGAAAGTPAVSRMDSGGIRLTSGGTANNQSVLLPNSDSQAGSALNTIVWDFTFNPWFGWTGIMPTDVTSCKWAFGFTTTPGTADFANNGTDDAIVRASYSSSDVLTLVLATTSDSVTTTVTASANVNLTQGSAYRFDMRFVEGKPYLLVNGAEVLRGASALRSVATASYTVKPFIAIETDTTGARNLTVRYVDLSQDYT